MMTQTNSQFLNELYQTFMPGATLDFVVNLTQNDDAGPTPDQFVFGILDNTLTNLPTTDTGNALIVVDIGSSFPSIQTFAATAPYDAVGTPTITFPQATVPEPDAWALLMSAAIPGAAFLLRRRNHT